MAFGSPGHRAYVGRGGQGVGGRAAFPNGGPGKALGAIAVVPHTH